MKERLDSVKGSLAVEGLYLNKEEELLMQKALSQLTSEEFDKKVMKLTDDKER